MDLATIITIWDLYNQIQSKNPTNHSQKKHHFAGAGNQSSSYQCQQNEFECQVPEVDIETKELVNKTHKMSRH